MHEATVCHLLRGEGDDQEILLAERASLFCNGIWNGPGGKMKEGERPLTCLARETMEEIGVRIARKSARHFATVDFYHPYHNEHRLEWRVHFFRVTVWTGEPNPKEGFSRFSWFKHKDLPYDKMMADQKVWVPLTLNGTASGRLLMAEIYYGDAELRTIDRGSFRFISA